MNKCKETVHSPLHLFMNEMVREKTSQWRNAGISSLQISIVMDGAHGASCDRYCNSKETVSALVTKESTIDGSERLSKAGTKQDSVTRSLFQPNETTAHQRETSCRSQPSSRTTKDRKNNGSMISLDVSDHNKKSTRWLPSSPTGGSENVRPLIKSSHLLVAPTRQSSGSEDFFV